MDSDLSGSSGEAGSWMPTVIYILSFLLIVSIIFLGLYMGGVFDSAESSNDSGEEEEGVEDDAEDKAAVAATDVEVPTTTEETSETEEFNNARVIFDLSPAPVDGELEDNFF